MTDDRAYQALYYRAHIAPKLGRRPAEMRACAYCGASKLMRPATRYCSRLCRQKAWRLRQEGSP